MQSDLINREPPYSIEAEQAVLGAILIDRDAILEVADSLSPDDFYRLAHSHIYRAMLDVWQGGEPPDIVLVSERIDKQGLIESVGGRAYLFGLSAATPTAVHVASYAKVVSRKAVLRRLISVAGSIAGIAYSEPDDTDDAIDKAQELVYGVAGKRVGSQYSALRPLLMEAWERVDQLYEHKGQVSGIPSGYRDLDMMTQGFHPSDLVILAARPSVGKAQPLDSSVLTPCGFVEMGRLRVGDPVIGADGEPILVTGVFPQGTQEVFEVVLSDGAVVQSTMDHLWFTQTRRERRQGLNGSVKTLAAIAATISRDSGGSPNHRLPLVGVVHYDPAPALALHPYLLGLLLGDGGFTSTSVKFSNPERDLQERLADLLPDEDVLALSSSIDFRIRRSQRNNEVSSTKRHLSEMGLMGLGSHEKFVPPRYMRASAQDRLALLRGLLDTDGFVTSNGHSVEFSSTSPALVDAVVDLVRSLGGIAGRSAPRLPGYTYRGERRIGRSSTRVVLALPEGLTPVSSKKHLERWRGRSPRFARSVVAVRPAGKKPCQCISVGAPDGLYVTDGYAVTHNTSLALNLAQHIGTVGKTVGIFSLEMSQEQLVIRLISSSTGVDSQKLRTGFMEDSDFQNLASGLGELDKAQLFIDDSPSLSVTELRTRARRMKMEVGLDLLIIDYLQLMHAPGAAGRDANRVQEVSAISRGLKTLARELHVPVIALSQLSRGVESRDSAEPRLSDLRESGSIEQDADMVVFLWRKKADEAEVSDDGEWISVKLAKNRNGPTGEFALWFRKSQTKFYSQEDRYA